MSTTTSGNRNRVIAVVIAIALGVGLVVAGAVFVYRGVDGHNQVTAQLSQERITVSPDATEFAGQPLVNADTAQAEADVVWEHMMKASGGRTAAEIPQTASPDDLKIKGTLQTGDAIRGSLLASVLAWNIATFVLVLGIIFILVGGAVVVLALLLRRPTTSTVTTA